ncbi:MAG TPA: SGNH/GDSL hydrolase family protein [Pyrinomonadaceae bacterium]|nr:SGNH/GDSL hydrolase family protein [Pyrinomonadaceae bacterium]
MKLLAQLSKRSLAATAAIVLVLSSSVCGQSPPPLASNKPAERQLNMLVLGDSIMWGQGLNEQHKAWYQVKSWLKENTNRDVRETVEAHSGALVGVNDVPPLNDSPPDGEVSSAVPTVNHEVDRALKVFVDSSQVDLVLVDGCINDVDVRNLLNAANSSDDVKRMAAERCGMPMQALLGRVVSSFSRAHVIVTGYFPIISEKTPNSLLMKAMARMFYQPGPKPAKLKQKDLRERLIAVSRAWYQASNAALGNAVKKTNEELAAKGSRQRVLFVEIPFPPEYSFNAPETRLWGFNASFLRKLLAVLTLGRVTLKTNDERQRQRVTSCNDQYRRPANETDSQKGTREMRRMLCRYASLGHPNRKGSAIYADAIVGKLKSLITETGWLRDSQTGARPATAAP